MDIVKKNLISIICGVIALLAGWGAHLAFRRV